MRPPTPLRNASSTSSSTSSWRRASTPSASNYVPAANQAGSSKTSCCPPEPASLPATPKPWTPAASSATVRPTAFPAKDCQCRACAQSTAQSVECHAERSLSQPNRERPSLIAWRGQLLVKCANRRNQPFAPVKESAVCSWLRHACFHRCPIQTQSGKLVSSPRPATPISAKLRKVGTQRSSKPTRTLE